MMWIEAALSSLLLGLAVLLLLQAPGHPSVFLDQVANLQLEDHAALLAGFGSDPSPGVPALAPAALSDDLLREKIFPIPEPFCYRWYWYSSNLGVRTGSGPVFSEDGCNRVFDARPAVIRSLERGVWRNGGLQFLHLDQASPSG